jgi:hypothetical protein
MASGISLSLSRLGAAEQRPVAAHETLPGRQQWNPAAGGAGRIDGVAKVTGAKLYASDFRAADLPGWPADTSHAILIRAPDATHIYTGIDLARLSGALKPSVVVTAEDLARSDIGTPEFYAGDLFCPVGKTPIYLGQPVALLIFERFDAFDQARLALRDGTFVKFGEETGLAAPLWRVSLYARGRGDARRARRLLAAPGRLGQSGAVSKHGSAGLGAVREGDAGRLCQGCDARRSHPGATFGKRSGSAGARSRIRNPVHRPDVSRAGMRDRLVRDERQQA